MSENTAPETIIDTDTPEGADAPTLPPHFDCLGPELHLTEAQTTLGTDDDGNHLMVANITVKGVPAIVRTLLANLMASPFALLLISDPEFNLYAAAASEGRLGIADDEDEEQEEKPKRGRPRKQPAAPAPVQSMQGLGDGEATEEPVKRGPGRPRKTPAPEAAPAAVAPVVVASQPAAVAPVPPAPVAVEQPDIFDDLEPAPAASPKANTAVGFNPPATELSKPRVGDLLRYLAHDAHSKGVTMELAIPQIGQWVVDNCDRIAALRSQSKEQVAAMLEKSLSKYIESNWPKS